MATSDPVSSDVNTGPSNNNGNDDEDVGYGATDPPAAPMDVDPPVPEDEPSGLELGEEWWVASETRVDLAATQMAATLAGLVAYEASSDDGSGEEEEEDKENMSMEKSEKKKNAAKRRKDKKARDIDDEREEEEEVDQLEGREVLDATPKSKGEIFLDSTCPRLIIIP